MAIDFEWSFRFGDVLSCVGGLSIAGAFLFTQGRKYGKLEAAMIRCLEEISSIKVELTVFSAAMTRLAVQEDRVNLLMRWYDELRNGRGIISEIENGKERKLSQ